MNLSAQKDGIHITQGDAHIILGDAVSIDGYVMDFPGEYESRGVFVEVRSAGKSTLSILTIEGKTLIYLSEGVTSDDLESLRDVNNKDMVVFSASESLWKVVETWEVSVAVPYGSDTKKFLTKLGQTVDISVSATVKGSDFETETTRFIALA